MGPIFEGKMPDNTEKKQKKIRFQKGQSGNPAGRPQGSRNKASLMAEQLFAEDIQDVCKSVIAKAKSGDMQAAKIILDRLVPPRKDNLVNIELPDIKTPNDILSAIRSITSAITKGEITPLEGEALTRILDINAKAIEICEFESMLTELENREDAK